MAKPTPPCGDPACPVHRVFDLLGRAHVLQILNLLVHEARRPWRFGEIKAQLGVTASVLSGRLKDLVEVGLVERREYQEMPPRVEYAATPDADELDEAFAVFHRWVAKRHKVRVPGRA